MERIIVIGIGVLAIFGLFFCINDIIQLIIDVIYKKYFGGVINEENNKLDSK